jgi:Skp family chaperone for outer membrane proteins
MKPDTKSQFIGLLVVLGGSLLLAALAAPLYASRPRNDGPGPLLIAHVDLERVFNECNLRAGGEAELETMRQRFDGQINELKTQVELLRQDVSMFQEGTEKYKAAERKFKEAAISLQAMVEYCKGRLDAARLEARKRILQQILQAAETFAMANNIAYVVSDDSTIDLDQVDEVQLVQRMALRRVLYAHPEFDLTDDLLAWINER